MNELQEFVKRFKKTQKDYETAVTVDGKESIMAAIQKLFDEHPELMGVRWRQYTPCFCDGAECLF